VWGGRASRGEGDRAKNAGGGGGVGLAASSKICGGARAWYGLVGGGSEDRRASMASFHRRRAEGAVGGHGRKEESRMERSATAGRMRGACAVERRRWGIRVKTGSAEPCTTLQYCGRLQYTLK
jgi:hypothetical protein